MNGFNGVPFNKPYITGKELSYISQAIQVEKHLSGDGPFTHRCQEWLENRLNCRKVFLTHSCTAALEMAAILCDIQAGDEVILPSFTFVSTANAFVLRGATPVFIDIRSDNLNLDESLIESAISEKTKAIVPVHYAGTPCAMDRIIEIAARHKIFIIEDAAQAFLSTYNNRFLGTFGSLGCLSFHETKNIISGEGGALLVNDESMIERAEIIREKGTDRSKFVRGEVDKYTWVDVGSSFLPSDLIAAFLYAQLEISEEIIASRNRIFDLYYQSLKHLENEGLLHLPVRQDDHVGNSHIFYMIARCTSERNQLIGFLKKRGIHVTFHYIPLHSSPAGLEYGKTIGGMKVTDDLSNRLLRLPLYHEMRMDEVIRVIESIDEFYSSV